MKTIFEPMSKEKFKKCFVKMIKSFGCYKNSDDTWSCDKGLYLDNMDLPYLPVKFKEIRGNFYCYKNNLTSFNNFPDKIGGDFYCNSNKLTSLENFPKVKGGILSFPNPWKDEKTYKEAFIKMIESQDCKENFDGTWSCDNNVSLYLMNLSYLPVKFKEVKGSFYCEHNKFTSFDNFPDIIYGGFFCSNNKFVSLDNFPEVKSGIWNFPNPWKDEETYKEAFVKMIRSFDCYENSDGSWSCNRNLSLDNMDLMYLPIKFKEIKSYFSCEHNKLSSFDNFPDIICNNLYICYNNIPDDLEYPEKVNRRIIR